jgi:hypothetical protein
MSLTHPKIDDIANSLVLQGWQKAELHRLLHDHVVQEPGDGGPVRAASSTRTTLAAAMQAAEHDHAVKGPALRYALGSLRSAGISADEAVSEGEFDVAKLDRLMAAKQLNTERRISIKTAFARAGISCDY